MLNTTGMRHADHMTDGIGRKLDVLQKQKSINLHHDGVEIVIKMLIGW